VPDDSIEAAVFVMERANWHTYQVLTKRFDRFRALLRGGLPSADSRSRG
jgi:protein gp37